ncbi:SUKH-4 family immunity protein [Streptomyces sp. NPDC005017]|uniref:SUKH-4 family immunity protein n=1 Tax=Streptomyces sp. NPDC005017 TaxID=3364706 RepID=UPI0036AD42DB
MSLLSCEPSLRLPPKFAQGRSGLALDLPYRLLDREFGRGRVVRFEDVDFPTALTHEPTRRFLRETGLPEEGFLFRLDTDIPLAPVVKYCAEERPELPLPAGAGCEVAHLIRLGRLTADSGVVLDGRTGAVLDWSEPEGTLHPLATDVSTLAFSLWQVRRESALLEGSAGIGPA